ncbi:probable cytochrome P450 310a1 isoform X2 [Eurosta solidaginis]|uniref:probable cytochrome P450 310a1 isoform X2 n=1 Tax=Eurosta solidaginis TaxID=178769 RepID=UPI00353090D3
MWLLLPILFYSVIFLYVRHVYTHWIRNGFPAERTGLHWQFLKQVYSREFQHVNAINEAYKAAGDRSMYGVYFFFRPTLLLRDVSLARDILEPIYGHFEDKRWNYIQGYRKINLLEKLGPIFSIQRIEGMFRNVEKVADHMVKQVDTILLGKERIDMQIILRTTLSHLPKKSSLTYRLRDIIKDTVRRREDGSIIRKDIIQLLVKFRNGNNLVNNSKLNWHVENVYEHEKLLSVKKLSKFTERFLNIGYEATASTATLTLYEILQSPSIHRKLLEEVRQMAGATKNADNTINKLTYADIDSLKYLSACIQETIRKYPSVPYIERVCRKNYPVANSRVIISEGRTIMVPIMAMQRDERNFKDPDYYRPERFYNVTQGQDVHNFMGYGLGSSICVARNFSTLVIKLALVKLLSNFDMEYIADKDVEILYNPSPVIKCKDGLSLKVRKFKNDATCKI